MNNWTDAERLIVEYTKLFEGRRVDTAPEIAIVEHGRKLIAEAEPKMMTWADAARVYDANERGGPGPGVSCAGLKAVLNAHRNNIAAVLDKKLADEEGKLAAPEPFRHAIYMIRAIVAETLKSPS